MIKGIHTDKFPYKDLSLVGALLFKEYPSTLVYSDKNKLPYVVEWVDVDDNGLDKFFIYQTTPIILKQYIENKISHYELIKEAHNGFAVFFDGQIEEPVNMFILNVDYIEDDYLPSYTNFFNKDDSDDFAKISIHFALNSIILPEVKHLAKTERPIEYHSQKRKTELFRVHLNTNKFIGHGSAQTNVLGNVLLNIEGLYHEMASDIVKGKNRLKNPSKKADKTAFKNIANTEVVIQEAASFSFYIRPIVSNAEIKTTSNLVESSALISGEQIFKDVLGVIENTETPLLIEKIKDKYSPEVFVKLKELVDYIKKNDLEVDLDYYSPSSKNKITETISNDFASRISNTLALTKLTSSETPEITGKFKAINCKTHHYTLTSTDEAEFSGYFDELIWESMPTLNFQDQYVIKVQRTQTKNIADRDYKTEHKVIATAKKV